MWKNTKVPKYTISRIPRYTVVINVIYTIGNTISWYVTYHANSLRKLINYMKSCFAEKTKTQVRFNKLKLEIRTHQDIDN